MRYTYHCPTCGYTERDVPVDDRDLQACDCGIVLDRVFEPTSNIMIPQRMRSDHDTGDLDAKTPAGIKRQKEAIPCGKGSRWV
jgi:hypothetical protein